MRWSPGSRHEGRTGRRPDPAYRAVASRGDGGPPGHGSRGDAHTADAVEVRLGGALTHGRRRRTPGRRAPADEPPLARWGHREPVPSGARPDRIRPGPIGAPAG